MKLALVFLSVAASALADSAHSPAKRVHHANIAQGIARRNETQELSKRDSYSGTATWYWTSVGPGACGETMPDDSYTIALNSAQLQQFGGYQNGKPAVCDKSISISFNGNTQNAVIKDECPTCGYGDLDLSRGVFSAFTGFDTGTFHMTWWFNDGTGGGGGTTTDNNNNNNNNNNQQTTTTQQQQDQNTWTSTSTSTSTTSSTPTSTPSSTPPPTTSSAPSSSDSGSYGAQNTPTTQYQDNMIAAPKAVVQIAALLHAAMGH